MPVKISEKKRAQIFKLLEAGIPLSKVAVAVDISEKTIRKLRNENVRDKKNSESVKSSQKGGSGTPQLYRSSNSGSGTPAVDQDTPSNRETESGGEKINFIGGREMNKEEKKEEYDYQCAECGFEFNGKPEKCPSCGIELEYD